MKTELKLASLLLAAAVYGFGALGQTDPTDDAPRRSAQRGDRAPSALAARDSERGSREAGPDTVQGPEVGRERDRDATGNVDEREARPRRRGPAGDGREQGERRLERRGDLDRGSVGVERGPGRDREDRPRGLRRGPGGPREEGRAEAADVGPARRQRLHGEAGPMRVERADSERDGRGPGVRGPERRGLRLRDGEGPGWAGREAGRLHGGRRMEARREERLERRAGRDDVGEICPRCGQPVAKPEGRGTGRARRPEAPDRAPGRRS